MLTLAKRAKGNFVWVKATDYLGRLIVVGIDSSGQCGVELYAITGRSENSQNRVLSCDNARVFTEPADPSKVKNPELIIYNAMNAKIGPLGIYAVSNGEQTDAILPAIVRGKNLTEALLGWCYEPDAPHFTNRISAVLKLRNQGYSVEMSVLRKSEGGNACHRLNYCYNKIPEGFGYCITTYTGDGNPLPAFMGDPLVVPLTGNIDEVANAFWDALNEKNRVSVAVKFTLLATGKEELRIINRFNKA